MDGIDKLYQGLSAVYDLGTPEEFRKKITDEEHRKKLYEQVSPNIDLGVADFPAFSQKIDGYLQQQSFAQTTGGGNAFMPLAGIANRESEQRIAEKEAQMQREEQAQLPITDHDSQLQEQIRQMEIEGKWGKPNGTTFGVDKQTGMPTITKTEGDGMHLYAGEQLANQDEIDALKGQLPSYLTREVKTPEDLLVNTAEAWSSNTETGRDFKDMLDAGAITPEEYKQAMIDDNEDYINQQTRILGQKATNATISDISRTINPIIEQLQAERREAMQRAAGQGQMRGGAYGAIGAQMSANTAYDSKKDAVLSEYLQAQQYLVDAIKISEAAQKGEGFWKGLGKSVGDADTWDMGISQLVRSANLKKIVEKYEKQPDSLTDSERALMDAAVAYMSACAYNSDKLSRGYKAGQTTGESLPFMLQFAVMPIGAIKDKVAKGILGYGIEQFGGKALQTAGKYTFGRAAAETGVSLLGNMAAAGVQTGAFGGAKIAEGTISRMTGDIKPEFDENGRIVYGGRENQQGLGEALWNAGVDTYVENLSEMILTSGDPIKAWVGGTNLFKNLSKNETIQVLAKMSDKWSGSTMGKIAGQMQFRNYPEEVAEEYVGNLLRWGMSTDVHSAAEAGLDADSQIDLWMGLAPTSIAFAGLGLGEYSVRGGIDRFQSSQAARKLRNIMLEGEERKYLDNLLKSRDSDEFKFAAHDVVKSILRNDKLSAQEKRAYLDNLYVTYQSQLALEAEDAKIADEVKTEVQGITNNNNGYVYPVSLAGEPDTQGHIVAGYIEVDETDPSKPRIGNDEIVTVKLNDGRVVQLSTKELDLTGTPQMAQEVFNARSEERINTQRIIDQSKNTFHQGDVATIQVPNEQTGETDEFASNIVSVSDEGVEVEVIDPAGQVRTTVIPHDVALQTLAVVKPNSRQETPEEETPLAEQQTTGAQQTQPQEQTAVNMPTFVNGDESISVMDNQDGTYTNPATGEIVTREQMADNGYAFINPQPTSVSQGPVVQQAPVETQASEVQQTEVQEPAAPVVPNIETMSADELGGSTVEYMGDRASAMAYLEAERDKADAEVQRTSKLKVTRFNGPEDFKRQNDQIQAAKRAAIDRYNKLQNAITAANAYKTLAEQQEEAERKAREAALREQRRQLAEAETAGDIEAKWQNTKKTVGFAATKTLPNGQKVNGHYILTEAGDVVPSHDPRKNYADSEGYVMENGQNVNDNNYKDPDVQRIALDIAQNYGGQAVEQMPFLENRAGRVLSGNNRTISGIIAAENNTDQAYLAALAENAQQYGFTPEQLAEYEHPRLQFVVEDELPFTTATFAMFNQQEKKTKSSVNRAVANSKMVTEAVRDKMLEIMDQYESLDSFFGSESAAADIVQSLINEGLMTQQEVAGLTENTGSGFKFGQSGREYVTDMLLGTLFDEQTIKMLAGEKTLKQAILRALPSIVANRRLKGYELTDSINNAIQLLYEARKANEGKSTADAFQLYLRQVDAFKGSVMDRYNGFDIILANRMSAGVEQLREILGLYNNSAMNEANGQMGFFEPRTIDDIKQDVYEYYTNQQPELAASLNGAAATGAQPQSAVPSGTANEGEVRPTQREQLTEYLNGIADEEHPFELFDDASTEELLRRIGASEESIERVKIAVANGAHVNGIKYKGRIYLNVDECNTPELARTNYVHERQHLLTTKADLDRVFNAVSYQELNEIVDALAKHSGFYLGRDFNELADEFISFGMEAAYQAENDAELEAALRQVGANDELVNIIKSINNEQRANENLSKGRRNAVLNDRSASSSPESGRDQTSEPAGVGEQGTGIDQRSLRRTEGGGSDISESGAEQVTPFEKTRLGLVAAEFRRQYPDAAVGVLFREKDSYEFYDKDAVRAAEILGLQTTEKDGVPFLSFPLEKLQDYLGKLVRGGMKIGIARKPDHKPTKGDYQIGDSLTYNGKTATIQDFTPFGTAILDVEGRRVEVSKEQLDDILDYGDYMYHVGDVVTYNGKRAQIVDFASGDPVIQVEGEGENRYVSFSDIERVKKEPPTEDNAHLSDNKSAFVAPQMPIDTQTNAQKQSKTPAEEEQQQAAQYLNEALQEVIRKSGDKLPQNITIDENTIEDNPDSVEMTARLLIDGKPSDFSVTIFDQSLGARGGFDPVNMVKFYPREELDKWDWDLADRLAEEFNKTRTQESGLATVMDESDAVYFFNMQAALDFAEKARQEITPSDDPRFAISGTQVIPVGEKTLVGLHNISAEKLRKVMKAGGLANPSAAVIDIAKQDHHDYGEVSLVLPSSLVERADGTYPGDAWTPMYPPVEYRAGKDTEKRIKALTKGLPDNLASAIALRIRDYMDGNSRNSGMEYLYLKEQGRELPIEHTPRRYPYISIKQIADRLGIAEPEYWSSDVYQAYEQLPEDQLFDFNLWLEQNGNQEEIDKRKAMVERWRSEGKDAFANTWVGRQSERMSFAAFDSAGYRILRDERDAGEENTGMTLDKASYIVDTEGLRPEFETWLQQQIDGLGYEEVLFGGYTPSGNRRWLPNTVENASKLMNQKSQTNYLERESVNETKAMLMEKFRTLAQIRKHRDILEPDREKIKEAYEAVSSDWNQLGMDFRDYTQTDKRAYQLDDNPFIAIDTALARIQEAMFKADPIAFLNREYRYSLPADSEFGTRIKEIKERIKNLPSRYFETKFRRPVYLNEFANAVVPNDLPQDLRAGLESAGLRLFSYNPNAQGSRRDATLEATAGEGIRFSISSAKGSPSVARRGNLQYSEGVLPSVAKEMESIKNNALNDGTFMKAPNGKPTNLDERQWLQVRLRSFKRWFGDWENDPANASKIVDANGEPMVVYHGRSPIATFTEFRPSPFGSLGAGIYFAPDRSSAEAYSRRYGGEYGKENVIEAFLNMRNPLYTKGQFLSDAERAELENHDGVIFQYYGDIIEINAHAPNQIKSATDNNGDFSEENDDIRFSISNQNNDIFYSNAERAVEGIKQEKATPEQWRAMIEKAGGLKAGEDKWIGLSDWLAQQRPTVTPQEGETRSQFVERAAAENKRFTLSKQDLLDYIREHKIQIEETEYGGNGDRIEDTPAFKEFQDEYAQIFNEKYRGGGIDGWAAAEREAMEEMTERHGGDDFGMAFYGEGDKLRVGDEAAATFFITQDGSNPPINETRLTYTTEGLENKREIALVVPTIEAWNESDEIHFGDAGPGKAFAWVRFGDAYAKGDATIEQQKLFKELSKKYNCPPYALREKASKEDIERLDAVEAKINEEYKTNGYGKVLVIDEIQSKRHQEGREKGYRDRDVRSELKQAEKELEDFKSEMWNKYVDQVQYRSEIAKLMTEEEVAKADKLVADVNRLRKEWNDTQDAVPSAPFEKNWHELAMKRILRFAAENGYDKVAWTTGDQQAARYDIGKVVDMIEFSDWIPADAEDNDYGVEHRKVVIHPRNQMDMWYYVDRNGNLINQDEGDPNTLAELVGKDLARNIVESSIGNQIGGEGLRIGGEGMRGFYDDILPRFMQKYGKKWGVQVGEVTMPQLEEGYQTMHAIDINDAMRESVLEGQPMFSISGRGVNGTMKPQEGETRSQYIARVAETVKNMTPRNTTIDDAIRFSITVNHNSPYLLKKADGSFVDPETGERLGFDHRFMGKGEGGQAHGWGSYFSARDIRQYADQPLMNGGITQYFDVDKIDAIDPHGRSAAVRAIETYRRTGIPIDQHLEYQILDYQKAADKHRAEGRDEVAEQVEVYVKEFKAALAGYTGVQRHHYTVEIPDNDGTNYFEEDQPLTQEQIDRLRKAAKETGIPKFLETISGFLRFAETNPEEYPFRKFYSDITDFQYGYPRETISNFLKDAGFVGIHYDGRRDGECYVIFDENDAVITDHIRFAISGSGNYQSRNSIVTEALVKQANDSFRLMQSALRKVSADLRTINAIRTQQFEYDRKVVNMLLDLYNSLLQENSVWAGYMPDTTRRIATQIVHAIGKKDISAEVNTIMDHMVHAQAKAAQRQWDKLRTTPVDKINISGVVMQGKVALQGQHALKAMNEALDSKATIEQLEDQIAQLMDMEDNATDESLKLQYKGQWIGYTIAAQHLERIQHLVDERNQLDIELQAARSNRAIKPSARQQLVANIQQAMRDNYIAQADAYAQSAKDLAEYVTTQEEQAKDFIHRQDANRDKIRSYAQRDLEGLATNPNRNRTRGNIVRQIWDAFASPIRDLQSLLRLTGLHAPDGEGYLYNHFMRGWMDGADKERLGIVNASKTLDAKISELTHGKYKTWEEAARKINDASHNMFTITMLNGVDGKDMPVTEDIPLSAGNALYIYAVNKMNDGRMKLAGMNITEEDVKALTDKVREQFGQEILDVVDWVQSEYFSQLRNRYNPTHEALFGAPMDAIENYFPLRINAAARQQNEDLSEPDTDAARLLAGTSTGAIKRRTKNSLPLDVRNADFFQEVIRHIAQMERWNAFAQWNRDANILFSDINFRNRIKGMNGTIYGSGDQLYNYMKDAFRVAIGTYKPKTDTFSEITLNIAKGVTSAKINFRVWTAMKQIASFPAFFTYMTDGVFVGSYLRNWMKPHETMKWAKEHLPNFEKRVSKRDMGDMRLMQRTTDWQWNKRVLEWSQKYGMAANVYFDTLTCATGARAVYDSRLAEYLKKGYPQEQAEQRARQDAEQAFNTSQQSSEGAFMSAVQMDRNLVTAALTVFRTSPIQYTRNFFYHTRNLLRKFQAGRKEEQIAFRMGQYKNDGLNDEQARKAAEKDYNKSIRSDIAGFVVYGALLNILWRLVGQVPYLLFGDDDDKKKQILDEATSGGAWFSPFTGLLGGGIVESALDGNGSVADMFAPEMPFTQDIKRAGQYLSNDKYAEFASQALSVLMQSGTGFDPQTAADMIQRVVTTIDSEEELSAAEEAIRISQALLSIPQSQYEQQLVDRVLADESEYDAALEDYIRYQKVHTAPLTWWMRGDESNEKAEENAEKRFNKLLSERNKIKNPEDYEE